MKKITAVLYAFLSAILLIGPSFHGFFSDALTIPPVTLKSSHVNHRGIATSSPFSPVSAINSRSRLLNEVRKYKRTTSSPFSTNLSMYNLPPGGGGGKDNDIAEIAKGALSIVLTIAFFLSPVGGFVLGIFNSFLVLLILLPLVGLVGFQIWQKTSTIQAPCPSCGTEISVLKNKARDGLVESDAFMMPPSRCMVCGAFIEANADNTGINDVTGRKTVDDLSSNMGNQASLFDFFSNSAPTETTSASSSSKKSDSGGVDKNSVIDVDVLDKDDKPFQ